jgi:hypothetical protein
MRSPRRGYLEPPRWNIDPASFRTSLLHAVWFIVGAVGVHAIHDLRSSWELSPWLTLY